jgi:hypothetical protein
MVNIDPLWWRYLAEDGPDKRVVRILASFMKLQAKIEKILKGQEDVRQAESWSA